MSKNKKTSYNKDTMKTLDAKALQARKDNLHAEFEKKKKHVLAIEKVIVEASQKKEEVIGEMNKLIGAYGEITELERSIGIEPKSPKLPEKVRADLQ